MNGIRYLRSLNTYPARELRKRYKEPTRTQFFIDQCLFIADTCLTLQAKNDGRQQYTSVLPSEYVNPTSQHYYLNNLKPHLLFTKQQGKTTTNYVLEVISSSLLRYQLRGRLKNYVEYLADDWDDSNVSQPIALFVCSSTADLLYVKRRIKMLLEDQVDEIHVRVTTADKVKTSGVASMVWEEV